MVTLHSVVDNTGNNNLATHSPTESSIAESAWADRLELINGLQSSLILEDMLQGFTAWLKKRLPFDSLTYSHTEQAINIAIGNPAKHSCSYNLATQHQNLGSLQLTRGRRFSEEELAEIELNITALLYPVRNALQYREALQTAMLDTLTGTGNRMAMDNALHRELQLSERYSQALSLLMIDIDSFKKINDTYGHSQGDEVLKQVAATIKDVTRQTDMTFRYGGEEFVVVLSKTDIEGAAVIAERVRENIANCSIAVDTGVLEVTVSVGVSTLHPNEHVKSLFERADKALYTAKKNGKNRIERLA